jgi:type II secretory pathway pseudopilin PulG
MKNQKTNLRMLCAAMLLALGILGTITFVSCADEDESANNSNGNVRHSLNKTGVDYSNYESVNIDGDSVMELTREFSEAINDKATMPDLDIKSGLLAMETFFNYGIVAKQANKSVRSDFYEQNFEFTVACHDDIINGDTLKRAYITFLNRVIAATSTYYVDLSDLTVIDQTDTNIIFNLRVPSALVWDEYILNCPYLSVVRHSSETFTTPSTFTFDPNIQSLSILENKIEQYSQKQIECAVAYGIVSKPSNPTYTGNVTWCNVLDFSTNYLNALTISVIWTDPYDPNNVTYGVISANDMNNIILPNYCRTIENYVPYYNNNDGAVLLSFQANVEKDRENPFNNNDKALPIYKLWFGYERKTLQFGIPYPAPVWLANISYDLGI